MSRRIAGSILRPIAVLVTLAVPLASGCSSQSVTKQWHDPTFRASFQNVLVIAIRKEEIHRRQWEDAFVAEFRARGVPAVPSYQQFPDVAPDTQQVIASVREHHYDGVLVSSRLPNTTATRYIPGHTDTQPVTTQDVFSNAYTTRWTDVQVPGYTETNVMRHYTTDLWQTGDSAHVVWTGTIESAETSDPSIILETVGGTIAPQMEKAGVLPPRRK